MQSSVSPTDKSLIAASIEDTCQLLRLQGLKDDKKESKNSLRKEDRAVEELTARDVPKCDSDSASSESNDETDSISHVLDASKGSSEEEEASGSENGVKSTVFQRELCGVGCERYSQEGSITECCQVH